MGPWEEATRDEWQGRSRSNRFIIFHSIGNQSDTEDDSNHFFVVMHSNTNIDHSLIPQNSNGLIHFHLIRRFR